MGKNLILSSIYTAKQCVDINDCNIAIERCKKLISEGREGYERSLYRRLLSLEKRKAQLKKD